jgi:hypothetical protein
MIGSCFTTEIAIRLQQLFYKVTVNPFGVVFNPHTISQLLLVNETQSTHFIQSDHIWYHWWMNANPHSHPNKEVLVENIKAAIQAKNNILSGANWLVITLGTAYVYEHIKTGITVGNCHKMPAQEFYKKLLTVSEVVSALSDAIACWRKINTTLKILFTVSPVRHLKDGFHENSVSKATLHLAIHNLQQTIKDLFYFPAYELLIDDLRDYRFYGADMVHPTEIAAQYIWQKFQQCCLHTEDHIHNQTIADYRQLLEHKVAHQTGIAYEKYLQRLQMLKSKVEQIIGLHPPLA